jgi:predicted O-linked N-acetylglucosamine transferase (SPINDLY family)
VPKVSNEPEEPEVEERVRDLFERAGVALHRMDCLHVCSGRLRDE